MPGLDGRAGRSNKRRPRRDSSGRRRNSHTPTHRAPRGVFPTARPRQRATASVPAPTARGPIRGIDDDTALATLRARLEFLFSDSNLDKDAYLVSLMHADGAAGAVPIAALGGFRRIDAALRAHSSLAAVPAGVPLFSAAVVISDAIGGGVEDSGGGNTGASNADVVASSLIRHAVAVSPSLLLTASGTAVRRATPRTSHPAAYYEERTLYAEALPLHSHVDALVAYFGSFGPVTRVDMPRFPGGHQRRWVMGSLNAKGAGIFMYDRLSSGIHYGDVVTP